MKNHKQYTSVVSCCVINTVPYLPKAWRCELCCTNIELQPSRSPHMEPPPKQGEAAAQPIKSLYGHQKRVGIAAPANQICTSGGDSRLWGAARCCETPGLAYRLYIYPLDISFCNNNNNDNNNFETHS